MNNNGSCVQSGHRQTASPAEIDHTLLIVGPQGAVSRALVCAIGVEFPSLSIVTVSDPAAAEAALDASVRLVAVSSRLLDASRALVEATENLTGTGFTLLVDAPGQIPWRTIPESPAMRGILPMYVGLDIWLAILRIMLHGDRYFPSDCSPAPPVRPRTAATLLNFNGSLTRSAAKQPNTASAPQSRKAPPRIQSTDDVDATQDHANAFGARLRVLTAREHDVLRLVALGWQNKNIAGKFGISENTIKIHLQNINRKLGVTNRTQAAAHFLSSLPAHGRDAGRVPQHDVR